MTFAPAVASFGFRSFLFGAVLWSATALGATDIPAARCTLKPSQLDSIGTRLVKRYYDSGESVPNIMQLRTGLNIHISSKSNSVKANSNNRAKTKAAARPAITDEKIKFVYEAFIRPLNDEWYSIPVMPLVGVKMSRANDIAYLCATGDGQAGTEKLSIYFMHGVGLEQPTFGTFFGDMFRPTQIRVAPLGTSIVGLGQLPDLLARIPIIRIIAAIPAAALGGIERLLEQSMAAFAGTGVERIVITPKGLELASGVDLENPENARILKYIPFE
jgi:hypothetical protein